MLLDTKFQVDRLFDEAPDRFEQRRCNPVTGSQWLRGVDPIRPQKLAADRALTARERFANTGPQDALPLPLSYAERERLKGGGLPHMIALYARSLEAVEYNFEGHPNFDEYARGVMASDMAPAFIRDDACLLRRYPPASLVGMGPGLVWRGP